MWIWINNRFILISFSLVSLWCTHSRPDPRWSLPSTTSTLSSLPPPALPLPSTRVGINSRTTKQLDLLQGNISHIRLAGDHGNLDRPCDDNIDGMIRLMTDLLKKYTGPRRSPAQIHHLEGARKGGERRNRCLVHAVVTGGLSFIGDYFFSSVKTIVANTVIYSFLPWKDSS